MTSPQITTGRLPDNWMMPPRPKRGIKPYNIDRQIILEALDGRVDGLFETPGQAAYAIANKHYRRDDKRYDAFRSLLKRRFKQYFA